MDNTYLDNKIKSSCNGCGVCALVCPKKCIKMVEDGEGFLYPEIDRNACISCGRCRKFCANFNEKKDENERAFMAINNSKEQLKQSSSGGMFYILAEYVLEQGGVVFGVTYNNKLVAVHEYAETLEACMKFCGSKYVRSDLEDSYSKVKEFLDTSRWVLFTGTACQISGLKKFLQKDYDKLVLCDILCHANPSPKVFKYYVENLEKNKGKKVKNVWFRSKENGWRNQTPIIEYVDGEKKEENSYFRAFVSELINRPSCYSCQFASKRRVSDFTIADFWGVEKVFPDVSTENGVSLLSINSKKAITIFEQIKDKMEFRELDYELACTFNHYHNVKVHEKRNAFFEGVISGKINGDNVISVMNKYCRKPLHKRVLNKAKKCMKKIIK